jgi:hypothetical protein
MYEKIEVIAIGAAGRVPERVRVRPEVHAAGLRQPGMEDGIRTFSSSTREGTSEIALPRPVGNCGLPEGRLAPERKWKDGNRCVMQSSLGS